MKKYQVPKTLREKLREDRLERAHREKLWKVLSLMGIMVVILLIYMGYQLVALADLLKQL